MGLQTSDFFLLLPTIGGTFSLSPTAKSDLCLKQDFCLLAFFKKGGRERCVLHIQLKCRPSLSLCPASLSSDEYCSFI